MGGGSIQDQLRRLGLGRGAQSMQRPARRGRRIEDLIAGTVVQTSQGTFFLHRESLPLDYRHGQRALSDLLAAPRNIAARLARDERLAAVDPRRMAFLDTETTGLAGGTGTYAFLVGVGTFEAGQFTVHQFFMRDYDEEPAQLLALGELLDRCQAVVSFNGRAFDMPLLETRFHMVRQPPRLIGSPHLDLLATSRTFWKHRLASCALPSLEAEVLAVRRTQEDVPGWLIPSLYFDYTRSGDAREMPRIFYHNVQDILSLVALMASQCALLGQPTPEGIPGEDLYGLGRFLHSLGDLERAESAFAQASHTCSAPEVGEAAMRELAFLLKRSGRRSEAVPWWRELADTAGAAYACDELAKHYEWHEVDLVQALSWTERGLALAGAWPADPRRREVHNEFEYRRARLERKIAER